MIKLRPYDHARTFDPSDSQSDLRSVPERITDHPIHRIEEQRAWNGTDPLTRPSRVTDA